MNESLSRVAARDGYETNVAGAAQSPGAVSWGAIIAGAVGAAALSLILLILGTGLGMSSVSPWSGQGASAVAFGAGTIIWITFTQLAASSMGGYLAGRLRTRWASVHTDEVYFRDTAHGFLAWAVATIITAAMLTSTISSIVSGTAQAGASVVSGAAGAVASVAPAAASKASDMSGSGAGPAGYFVDSLFRKDSAAAAPAAGASAPATSVATGSPVPMNADDTARSTAEVGRIFANAVATGSLSPEDTRYVGETIAQRTGISQADAEKRVSDTFNRMQTKAKEVETAARDAADKARKASAYGALWLFVSLLVGAFVASLSATYGGRRRDLV